MNDPQCRISLLSLIMSGLLMINIYLSDIILYVNCNEVHFRIINFIFSDLNVKSVRRTNKSLTSSSKRLLSGTRPRARKPPPTPSRPSLSVALTSTRASQRSGESLSLMARSSKSRWFMTRRLGSRRVIALLNMSMR